MEILKIQKFCTHDGPGIRTTVFLKGCPLRCLWCHNPESIHPQRQKVVDAGKCIDCGRCRAVCTVEECRFCGDCADVCIQEAITLYGKGMTQVEVFDAVMEDRAFYETSGGGVTFSGGEPLRQAEALNPLMRRLKDAGCSVAIDTTGFAEYEVIESLIPQVDLWLYDLKGMDPERHRRHTGVDNGRILENLERLAETGARIWIRMPLVEGLNTSLAEIAAAARFIGNLNIEQIHLLPYHRYGQSKIRRHDLPADLELTAPREETLERIRHQLQQTGKPVIIGG